MRKEHFILPILIIFVFTKLHNTQAQTDNRIFTLVEEDFLTGPVGTDVTLLHHARDFAFDKSGNIFLLDAGNYRVLKFDLNGRFLLSFGRKGQGPGEFHRPHSITIDQNDNIYLIQKNKLFVYNNDGKYIQNIEIFSSIFKTAFSMSFTTENQFLANIFDTSDLDSRKTKIKSEIHRKQYIALHDFSNDKCLYLSKIHNVPFDSFVSFFTNPVINKNKNIYYGIISQQDYMIFKYSLNGSLIKTISKDYQPVKFSKEEKSRLEKLRKKIAASEKGKLMGLEPKPVAKYYNAINFLLIDSFDNLWVFTNERRADKLLSFDMFNSADNLVKSFSLKNKSLFKTDIGSIQLFGKYIYAKIINEDDEEKFVRFRLPEEIWN